MIYVLVIIAVLAVYFFAWCLCQAAGRNEYPDIIDDPSEDVK